MTRAEFIANLLAKVRSGEATITYWSPPTATRQPKA